jgi:hypothetical protein
VFAVVSAEQDRIEVISFRGKEAHDSCLNVCNGRAGTLKENGLDQGLSSLGTAETWKSRNDPQKLGAMF